MEWWDSGTMDRDSTVGSLFVSTSWLNPGIIYGTKTYGKEHEQLDQFHYKVENGLLKLIESLQKKQQDRKWEDSFLCR